MKTARKQAPVLVIAASVAMGMIATAMVGCSSSVHRFRPTAAAMQHHKVTAGDTVLVRYTNIDDPNSSSKSERVRLVETGKNGISGVTDNGDAVVIGYVDIFQVESRQPEFVVEIDSPAKAAKTVFEGVVYTAFGAAAVAICMGAPLECLALGAESNQ